MTKRTAGSRDEEFGPVSSVDQDEWLDIVRGIREQVRRIVPALRERIQTPQDLQTFVHACSELRWLNESALTMDARIDHANSHPWD